MINNIQDKTYTNRGFSLAEVLIALVIIGVIAAITIPILHANYTEQETYAKVKKVYSTLANAMTRVLADGGTTDFTIANSTAGMKNWYETYLKKYLIVTKECYETAGCWNSGDSKGLNGNNLPYNVRGKGLGVGYMTLVLNDGTFINLDAYSSTAEMWNYFGIHKDDSVSGMLIFFDINGEKGPNVAGRDIFVAAFTEDGFVPAFADATQEQINADCSASGRGYSCIQKYLKYK